MLERPQRQRLRLGQGRAGRFGQDSPQPPPRIRPDQLQTGRRDRRGAGPAQRPAQDAALADVEGRRPGTGSSQRAQAHRTGWTPSRASSFQKKAALTAGTGSSARVRRAAASIRYRAMLASASWATWSTASSMAMAWVKAP